MEIQYQKYTTSSPFLILAFFLCYYVNLNSQDTFVQFEGIIVYKSKVEILKQDQFSDYLLKKYGTEMVFTVNDNGDFRRDTKGNDVGLHYSISKLNTTTNYTKYHGFDTLYTYSSAILYDSLLTLEAGPRDTILDIPCESIFAYMKIPETGEYYSVEFYYAGYPSLDPELYKNFKDGLADVLYSISKSFFLKQTITLPSFSITYEAIKVEEKEIDEKEFLIPKDVPIKSVYDSN